MRYGRFNKGGCVKERRNVVLLFSKPPVPGLVKTRLTHLKDGIFEPEVASGLYHCMLFDVVEIVCAALSKLEERADEAVRAAEEARARGEVDVEAVRDAYELVISTTPASNVDVMRKLFSDAGTWPRPLTFIADEGDSFDAHYNHAFAQVWDSGADAVLSFGADMPALTVYDVIRGFDALHALDERPAGGIVIAPDQEMGVSVVGWTRSTDFDHTGVYYHRGGLTVLPAYIAKAREAGLPVLYLPPIPDVDTMADFMHMVTVVEALNYCAPFDGNCSPWRTAQALKEMGWDEVIVPPNDLHDPRAHIDGSEPEA